jgi:hypothetical protein
MHGSLEARKPCDADHEHVSRTRYFVIQEKIFKGMDPEKIYKRAEEQHRPSEP